MKSIEPNARVYALAAPGILLATMGFGLGNGPGVLISFAAPSLIGAAVGGLFRLAFVGAILAPVLAPAFYWLVVFATSAIY